MAYFNRYDPADLFTEIRFLAGRALQSAELNEVQSMVNDRIQGVADVLFNDGDVLAGGLALVEPVTGGTILDEGLIYLQGKAHPVAFNAISIPVDRQINLGVYVTTEVITSDEDASLLDPAPGTRNFGEPGADRHKTTLVWGYDGDGQTGAFFPVYLVDNGILVNQEPPPNLTGVSQALARYDRESVGGHYVVRGLRTRVIGVGVDNLVSNPNFNANSNGWSAASGATIARDPSTNRLSIMGGGTHDPGADVNVGALTADVAYRVAFDAIDVDTAETTLYVEIFVAGNFVARGEISGLATVEKRFTFDFIGDDAGDTVVRIGYNERHNGETAQIDNVVVAKSDEYEVSVDGGVANVQGYKVSRSFGSRLSEGGDADTEEIESEGKTFADDGDGRMTVAVNRRPLDRFIDADVRFERTENMTRGPVNGGTDAVSEPSVLSIERIRQGATTYTQGTDYRLTNGRVDWSPGGAEPAGGSTYEITFQYTGNGTIDNVTPDGFRVAPPAGEIIVAGSTLTYDYFRKLPRIDRIALTVEGELVYVKGAGHPFFPQRPSVPEGTLGLCTLSVDWINLPTVLFDAITAIPFDQIGRMQNQIDDLYFLISEERLKTNLTVLDGATKRGVFVDPFLDDDLRDQGAAQTAAVFGGLMLLPVSADPVDLSGQNQAGDRPWSLDYTEEFAIRQELHTGSMKVNPYSAFAPLPSPVVVRVEVDRWTEERTQWASPVTRRFERRVGSGSAERVTRSVERSVEVASRRSVAVQFCREIDLRITGRGFGPGERIDSVTFDGVRVLTTPATPTADGSGAFAASFRIPPGIPTGAKEIVILGAGGTRGVTGFLSQGVEEIEVRRQVEQRITLRTLFTPPDPDPLAQTFTLPIGRHVTGVDVIFAEKGNIARNRVVAQIRETQVGFPTQEVVAEGDIYPVDMVADGATWTTISFDRPVWLEGNREYAVVLLTDDDTHSVRVAQLGKFDAVRQRWVTAQPYQVGVLLSSSNASTWDSHQDRDMAYRLRVARFTATEKEIDLGAIPMTAITDILVGAEVEHPGADTSAIFEFAVGGETYETIENQGLTLPEAISGNVGVKMKLQGSAIQSPIVFPDLQVIEGKIAGEGTYISRRIPGGSSVNLRVVVDTLLPGTSSVTVEAEAQDGSWNALPIRTATQLPDGYAQTIYGANGVGYANPNTRIRLTLRGGPGNRPELRDLRAFVT